MSDPTHEPHESLVEQAKRLADDADAVAESDGVVIEEADLSEARNDPDVRDVQAIRDRFASLARG